MVVLNVLCYKHRATGLYVCYCYETDTVGTGHRLREAVSELEDNLSLGNVFPRQVKRRKDIVGMFEQVFFEGAKASHTRKMKSGNELHLYRFLSDSTKIEVRDVYEEIMKVCDRQETGSPEERKNRRGMNEEDIPF